MYRRVFIDEGYDRTHGSDPFTYSYGEGEVGRENTPSLFGCLQK